MDTTMMNNYNMGNMYGGYQPQYMQNPFGYSAYQMNQIKSPINANPLTPEEISQLKSSRPSRALSLNIDPMDALRARCTHKENNVDVSQPVQDGSGDMWCPICNRRWHPVEIDSETVKEKTKEFVDLMETAKWLGDLPINVVNDYYQIEPLVEKFPDLYNHGMSNFEKYSNQNMYTNPQDASIYSQFNSLFGPSPFMQQQYAQAMMNQYAPMQTAAMPTMPTAPQTGYYPNGVTPQVASPYTSPMQTPMGVNPVAPNQQFVNQAAMMMPGYGQMPTTPQQPQNFNFTTPQQPTAYQPGVATAPQQAPAATTPDTGAAKKDEATKKDTIKL